MNNDNISSELVDRVTQAFASKKAVFISAGNSKSFYGEKCDAEPLDVSAHAGITEYDPRELVITARAGTLLSDINTVLAESGQMLAFDPPLFNTSSTLGGAIATGLSGPRRPYCGSARDFVLGVSCINGKGEKLQFGGQVMKNVAGYDVSRLMCGSLGTLAVITEVSLKVLPLPAAEYSLQHECSINEYLQTISRLSGQPVPITASCFLDGIMYTRLSGSERSVTAARDRLPGEAMDETIARDFWQQLRDHQLPFFDSDKPLWRLSLPPDCVPLQLDGDTLHDWGGAQRWVITDETAEVIRSLCDNHNGHATLFRNNPGSTPVFHPLANGLEAIHKNLKMAFDPAGILNPGRMYKGL